MYISQWDMWVRMSDVKTEELKNGLFRVPTFKNVKKINGKSYGLFHCFIDMTEEEMMEG